jgi:two-component system sensor kinase
MRELAYLQAMRRRFRKARRTLDESLRVAREHGALFEEALTLKAIGEIGRDAGWHDAETSAATAQTRLGGIVPRAAAVDRLAAADAKRTTLSVLERFEALLQSGREIAAARTPDELVQALLDSGRQLFRGERAVVLDATEEPPRFIAASPGSVATSDSGWSRSIARNAVTSGRAAVMIDGDRGNVADSILLTKVASVLCAPIRARGTTRLLLYVSHPSLARMFGAEDVRLADFVAAVAGAALERAESYMDLSDAHNRLERQLEELQRAQTDLRSAWTAAESANRAKSEFLANVSHEIRSPLGAILGFADLQLDPAVAHEDAVEWARVIRRNGEKLLAIVNDVLDLSKIEAGKLTVEGRRFELAGELHEVIVLLRHSAEAKGVALRVETASSVPRTVSTDPLRFRQILTNLIGNAIKFTAVGAVTVRVGRDGGKIRVDVADTGVGIAADNAQRLFQPFVQADGTTTRKFGGTGLGLTLSRRLASLLGGDVQLRQSVPGQGSVFSFTFDPALAPTTSRSLEKEARQADSGGRREKPLAAKRVLVIEDAEDNQTYLQRVLVGAGAEVEVAPDGEKGVEKALSSAYDAILMDMQMPNMDGFEATHLLRERGLTTPIIAITASAMPEDRTRCLNIGCSDYVSKPTTIPNLIATVVKYAVPPPPA